MIQTEVIEHLYLWLKEQKGFGQCKCDHVTADAQTIGLYIGSKESNHGRSQQIAQADIIVHDEKNVKLIIEVDPSTNPKNMIGAIFSAIIAENFTPSYELNDKSLNMQNIAIVYTTSFEHNENSQKIMNIESINKALEEFIRNQNLELKIKSAKIIYGKNDNEAIENTKRHIKEIFCI